MLNSITQHKPQGNHLYLNLMLLHTEIPCFMACSKKVLKVTIGLTSEYSNSFLGDIHENQQLYTCTCIWVINFSQIYVDQLIPIISSIMKINFTDIFEARRVCTHARRCSRLSQSHGAAKGTADEGAQRFPSTCNQTTRDTRHQ